MYYSFTQPGLAPDRRYQRVLPDHVRRRRPRRQAAGHRLGNINPALYELGQVSKNPAFGKYTGIQDVTVGNISDNGVTGPDAGPGYDMATGWGTIDGARFVPALAIAASAQNNQGDREDQGH